MDGGADLDRRRQAGAVLPARWLAAPDFPSVLLMPGLLIILFAGPTS